MADTTNTTPNAPLSGIALIVLTFAIGASTFMEILDTTIVNVAIPHIAGSLGVAVREGTWAISSYALSSAIIQPLTGWIARRFGEIRTFTCAVLLFVLFSMLCGLATSMTMLVVYRLIQGAVSGPMMSLSLTLLLSNYPKAKQGIALALWAMIIVIAPIFGPILGGFLTDNFSWPWIFYINLPVGVLSALVTWQILHRRESKIFKDPIDIIGLILLITGVGCLQFMLDNGNDHDWFASPMILTLGIISLVSLSFLVCWEIYAKYPIIDLSLFKRRNFAVGVTVLTLGRFAFFGITVLFPLWLQLTLGYTATWAGLAIAPIGVLSFIVSPFLGKYLDRLDPRLWVSFGFIILAISAHWFSLFDSSTSFSALLPPRLLMGLAIPFFFIPLNQIYLADLPIAKVASASGLSNFFGTIGASITTAVSVTLWQHGSRLHHAVLAEHISPNQPATTQFIGHLGHSGLSHMQILGLINQLIVRESFTLSVNHLFFGFSVLFVLLIPLLWLSRPPFGGANVTPH